MTNRYPTRLGIAIPPSELELPPSRLNPHRLDHENNHHLEFTARNMGRFLLTHTLRNLESLQIILPLDVHSALHQEYDPPTLPTPKEAIERLYEAYTTGEQLRSGSAHHFYLRPISEQLWTRLEDEYDELN